MKVNKKNKSNRKKKQNREGGMFEKNKIGKSKKNERKYIKF